MNNNSVPLRARPGNSRLFQTGNNRENHEKPATTGVFPNEFFQTQTDGRQPAGSMLALAQGFGQTPARAATKTLRIGYQKIRNPDLAQGARAL